MDGGVAGSVGGLAWGFGWGGFLDDGNFVRYTSVSRMGP